MRPWFRWLVLAVLLAVAWLAGSTWKRARAGEVTSFYFNNLSATMQPSLEVDARSPEGRESHSGTPARSPLESRTAVAVIAVAGLALVLQQRARNKSS